MTSELGACGDRSWCQGQGWQPHAVWYGNTSWWCWTSSTGLRLRHVISAPLPCAVISSPSLPPPRPSPRAPFYRPTSAHHHHPTTTPPPPHAHPPAGINVHRFANRIPLLFEGGSDVITKTALKRINWSTYKMNQATDKVSSRAAGRGGAVWAPMAPSPRHVRARQTVSGSRRLFVPPVVLLLTCSLPPGTLSHCIATVTCLSCAGGRGKAPGSGGSPCLLCDQGRFGDGEEHSVCKGLVPRWSFCALHTPSLHLRPGPVCCITVLSPDSAGGFATPPDLCPWGPYITRPHPLTALPCSDPSS